jgi:hypothetical protein
VRNRLRSDSRVTVSMMATASAMRPATWPVSVGRPNPMAPMAEDSATGCAAFGPPSGARTPGVGLGVAAGLIRGNRPDALPAPMSELDTLLSSGMGPSGTVVPAVVPVVPGLVPGEVPADELAGEAGAAVTATVTAADGGVHFAVVAMLAVAVSVTEVTELSPAATGICAFRLAGCWPDTELTVHVAVPFPLAQPLVNAGFWPDGCALRATDTSLAEPLFPVETCTV